MRRGGARGRTSHLIIGGVVVAERWSRRPRRDALRIVAGAPISA